MRTVIAVATAASAIATAAPAQTVYWKLVDVTFADGGTLTGKFTDDTYLTSADFVSSGGSSAFPTTTITGADNPSSTIDSITLSPDADYANALYLQFEYDLNTPIRDNPIISGYETFGSYQDPSSDVTRDIVSGYASVPEGASWTLMLLGAAVVGGALRGGRRRAGAPA